METSGVNHPQRRRLRDLAASLAVISLFVLLWLILFYGIEVLFLIFAGILFGVFLRTISNWVAAKSGLSERIALGLTTLSLLLVLGFGSWALVPHLSKQVSELAQSLPKSVNELRDSVSQYWLGRSILEKAPNAEQVVTQNGGMLQTLKNAFRVTTMAIANIVAIFFLGLFFAASPRTYRSGVLALVPHKHVARAREILDELYVTLSRWLTGQLMAMAIVAVLTTLGLWLMKVELALVLGLIAGILAFIPNIGPVISAVPAVLIGLLDSPMQAVYIGLLYLGVQTVESYMITPLIQKKMVTMPPALVLSVQFIMGVMLGTMALAMATPLAAVVLVLIKMLYVHDMLRKHPTLPSDNANESAKEA